MAKAVTLAQLIAAIRWRADIQSMTARHSDADLAIEINRSWTDFRTRVSDRGSGLYLKWSNPTTMTVGAVSGHAYGSIPIPSDCVRIYGIDIQIAANNIRSLDAGSIEQRNSFQNVFGQSTGTPSTFFPLNIGTESTTSVTAGTLAIMPAPDRAYTYSICYVPAWTDITNTAYVFDGFDGWDDWVVWDVVCKVAARDNDMQQTVAIAASERTRAWDERIASALRVQRVTPGKRIDVAATRRVSRQDPWRRFGS